MAEKAKVTTDHGEIRRWTEARGGWPATVKATEENGKAGILRIDYPGFSGEDTLDRISWEEFFETFESNKLEKIDEENYKLYGTLSMRGISKPVVLNVEYGGLAQDPWGNTRIGVSVSGKINRKDFGVSFSMVSETGGILLGEEVTINANAEFIKQAKLEKQAA